MCIALLLSSMHVTVTASSTWYVDPITVKVMHDQRTPFEHSQKIIDLAGQRGECERAQIWAWSEQSDAYDVQVRFAELSKSGPSGQAFPPAAWSYKQQGYVNTTTSVHYSCSTDILTGHTQPSPPKNATCADTPWFKCQTGCSPLNSTHCAGKKPSANATCNAVSE